MSVAESAAAGQHPGYCGRFAPSPSGPLHFGSLVAAVAGFVDARARRGRWLLRVEDLDPPRVVPGAADAILATLDAYGLHWDGAVVYQSARLEHYRAALERLRQTGLVYPCGCSRRDIAATRTGPVYPGTCRNGVSSHRPPALRLRTDDREIAFLDRLQGRFGQRLESEVGDFVLRRADGVYAYQLAVVVDDAWQQVSDVVRGSDLLDSTPRQIYLQRLLGLPQPRYCHLPLALNRQGDKLSKQTGAPALDDRRPALALVAALDFLDQHPPPHLAAAGANQVLDWAVANWQPARIPALDRVSGNG